MVYWRGSDEWPWSRMITSGRKQLHQTIYNIINNTCAALRSHKYMGSPLGPQKNLCSLWLYYIPFCLTAKILICRHLSSMLARGGIGAAVIQVFWPHYTHDYTILYHCLCTYMNIRISVYTSVGGIWRSTSWRLYSCATTNYCGLRPQ